MNTINIFPSMIFFFLSLSVMCVFRIHQIWVVNNACTDPCSLTKTIAKGAKRIEQEGEKKKVTEDTKGERATTQAEDGGRVSRRPIHERDKQTYFSVWMTTLLLYIYSKSLSFSLTHIHTQKKLLHPPPVKYLSA